MADLNEKLKELNNTPDTTEQFDKDDIEKNKTMAILAYLSWLVLIPLFAAKDSKFARYHCNQGLVLAIAEIIISFLGVIPFIGGIISWILGIIAFIFTVIGILNAANGKAKELPIIGKFKLLK